MNPSERRKLISAWFLAHDAGTGSPTHEENWWAVEKILNLREENPELLWELILEAIEKEKNEKLLSNLAAAPQPVIVRLPHGEAGQREVDHEHAEGHRDEQGLCARPAEEQAVVHVGDRADRQARDQPVDVGLCEVDHLFV